MCRCSNQKAQKSLFGKITKQLLFSKKNGKVKIPVNQRKLLDGSVIIIPDAASLDCVKRRGKSTKRTSSQLQFIIDCMLIGDANHQNKMSPDFACKLMKLIGTESGHVMAKYDFADTSASGYNNFCRNEMLDIQQIKGYFGKNKSRNTN